MSNPRINMAHVYREANRRLAAAAMTAYGTDQELEYLALAPGCGADGPPEGWQVLMAWEGACVLVRRRPSPVRPASPGPGAGLRVCR
jgi:hypothetical protein